MELNNEFCTGCGSSKLDVEGKVVDEDWFCLECVEFNEDEDDNYLEYSKPSYQPQVSKILQ